MLQRISNFPEKGWSIMRQREPRQHNAKYLEWLRDQVCSCGCGQSPRSDAAHIRSGSLQYNKSYTGMSEKPHDFWCVPLNRACHRLQHEQGELQFWESHRKDPFALAITYNEKYFRETGKRADEPRITKAKSQRAKPLRKTKITKRKTPWPAGRKIANRGFQK
jgi:hypothetical protein